jgi:hypothetical protein
MNKTQVIELLEKRIEMKQFMREQFANANDKKMENAYFHEWLALTELYLLLTKEDK